MTTTTTAIEGIDLTGRLNTDEADIAANIRHAIRLGHPQVWPAVVKPDRIALVGGGPSLEATFDELRQAVFEGAKLVTVNGAYRWCLDRNLKPSAQIVLDARASNARFVEPDVPHCRYYLASQCHPETWAKVAGRQHVAIFHALAGEDDTIVAPILKQYYLGNWHGVGGGTTVTTRAIGLLRALGYLRYDLFGVDCCWMGDQHHAYAQPENERDRRVTVNCHPTDHPELARSFVCSPWHLKQFDDFLLMVRAMGHQFMLNVHGDGLLAYAMQSSADVVLDSRVDS